LLLVFSFAFFWKLETGNWKLNMNMAQRTALNLLAAYKRWISPMFLPACRYVPSCSDYAAEAISHHGLLHGTLLAVTRLLRCHPFVKGGFDPVPLPQNITSPQSSVCAHAHPNTLHS
jgi:putative membrane protein insertion efficiency factor